MFIQNTCRVPSTSTTNNYNSTKNRSQSLSDYHKTNIDFNSRLIINTTAYEPKTNLLRFNIQNQSQHTHNNSYHSYFNNTHNTFYENNSYNSRTGNSLANFNGYSTNNMQNTNSIKLRLQKVLGKQTRNNNNIQSQAKGHRKIKSLFYKGNYKLNKNKKQLEELNKKKVAQIIQKQNQQLKKTNRSNIFMIKQIKPIKFKTTATNILNSTAKSKNFRYDYQDQFQFLQQSNKNQTIDHNKIQIINQGNIKNKKVIQLFDRYKQDWYKKQQNGETFQDFDTKLGINTLKGKAKRRVTIRNRKNQEYEPWELDHSCQSPSHF